MKKMLLWMLAALLPVLCLAQGEDTVKRYAAETVPQTEILSWSYVTDLSGVISHAQKDSLNALCRFSKDSLQAEIAVVVIPAFDNGKYSTLHEFGVDLYNRWGIGGKQSRKGLLIALATAPGEREVSFITGYGMEGVLPDALCKRIQTRDMIPYMKDGEYGRGLIAGVGAVNGILRGDVDPDAYDSDDDGSEGLAGFVFVCLGFVLLTIVAVNASERKKRRKMGQSITCRSCGVTGDMKYVRSEVVTPATARHTGTLRHTYVCRRCGQENYVDEIIPRKPSGGSSGLGGGRGPIVGGFGGGSFSGGGSFGSFGGGMSGGGGASSRF